MALSYYSLQFQAFVGFVFPVKLLMFCYQVLKFFQYRTSIWGHEFVSFKITEDTKIPLLPQIF